MKAKWLEMAPKLKQLHLPHRDASLDEVMKLVFEIEQQTQATCGSPGGLDQALVLLSEDRSGVER